MDRTILDAAMAAAFVRRLGEHIDYNINVMDRGGVIIASRDPSRIGSYHEAAHHLVQSGRPVEAIEPGDSLPAGVKPGVNLPVSYKGETIGVVGVTGDPAIVGPIAYAVKTSVETMVELELYKDLMLRRQDRKNVLLNYLLYEDETPREAAAALATKLGYDSSIPRAPLLLRLREDIEAAEALKALKRNPLHGPEEISAVTNDGAILVFKSLRLAGEGLVAAFEAEVEAYLEAARAALEASGYARRQPEAKPSGASSPAPLFRAYVGMFQSDLARYGGAYRQALWLSSRYPEQGQAALFVHRRLAEYLASRVPRSELVDAFAPLASLLPPDFAADLGPSLEALIESGYNAKEAASRLGVHRNTLSARVDRVSALLGLDPRGDPRGRDLASFLLRFLEIARPV
jgi:carbohydrate diacid regulator